MENAAILASSWQKPALIIDPYNEGREFLSHLSKAVMHKNLIAIEDNV